MVGSQIGFEGDSLKNELENLFANRARAKAREANPDWSEETLEVVKKAAENAVKLNLFSNYKENAAQKAKEINEKAFVGACVVNNEKRDISTWSETL